MPIRIPNDLPAAPILRQEGLVVMREEEAARQDIRPLEIAILNLMPEKVKTETQTIGYFERVTPYYRIEAKK